MPSLLQQLENNEAILLMYLAGELPEEDRAEVEQLLASDAGFRRELEELRSAQRAAMQAMEQLDQTPPSLSPSVAVRDVVRQMRQWQVNHAVREPAQEAEKGPRYRWWRYPGVAAAVVLLGLLVWWGGEKSSSDKTAALGILPDSLDGSSVAEVAFDEMSTLAEDVAHTDRLEEAERQMVVLSSISSDIPSAFAGDPDQ